jgi:N-acetylglucosaminyldiphosphoundecaprenol N-acetyl-beta-D-mannosaminyltransferase
MDREAGRRRLDRPAPSVRSEDDAPVPRVDVLGVGISAIDMEMALTRIASWVDQRIPHYVCITGVHGVMECRRDPELRRIHNASGLTTPDGMPMVWAGRLVGAHWMRRVYGPDLMEALSGLAAQRGWGFYLYGGKEGVAERLAERLTMRHPGLRVVGAYSPPFRPLSSAEAEEVIGRINQAAPDIVWVGLGTPKQERWMDEYHRRLHAPVLIGVGAAFDFLSGDVQQAPRWVQRSGFEWLFRLAQEPRRLAARYLRNNPVFLLEIARHRPRLRGASEWR